MSYGKFATRKTPTSLTFFNLFTMLTKISRRNADFMKAVAREKAAARKNRLSTDQIIFRAIHNGAPAFYLSFETAVRMSRGSKRELPASKIKRQQWDEFHTLVREEMKSSGCDIFAAVSRVLAGRPASRFFISQRTALDIYTRHSRRR